jgi:ribulose-bisphosphate carboxylase large chain
MDPQEMNGFFADEGALARDDYLFFTYLFETAGDPRAAAASLAREQSTAQWRRPGIDEDFRPHHGAKVVGLEVLDESCASVFQPAQEGAVRGNARFVRARVRIAHPHANFGSRIPNLLTVAMGEGAFFCHGITAIKLVDIAFPNVYIAPFQGPQFGVRGLRELLRVWDRPLFFGVVKPNIGLDPASFAWLAREAWEGGLDAAKDDEMLADAGYSPFEERMRLVGEARRAAEQVTGEAKLFIANITDEVDRMFELHDIAVAHGVGAVMVNAMAVGLSAVRALRKRAAVPIVAHFDCIAPMSRHPFFGVATTVLTKLQRLCGCDAIIMPGFGVRMATSDEEVQANAAECAAPLGALAAALPVPGGSDWAGTLAEMMEKLRTTEFAMVPGRGVFGHPWGPRAGAASLRQAWEAIVRRMTIEELAAERAELREAIAAFGSARHAESPERMVLPAFRGFTGVPILFHHN